MKKNHEIICLTLFIVIFAVFAACSNGDKKADASSTVSTVSEALESTEKITTEKESSKESTTESTTKKNKTTQSTTTPMPSTQKEDEIPISVNEALDRLSEFYGAAYNVNATVKEDEYQYFKVTDNKGNDYAKVKVNLKNSNAEETIIHSGEVNKFNLLV